MTEPTSAQDLFKGRHFDQEIIILRVRWYITFKLSFRDLVQMMAERGITLSHTTILRWVQQYVPEFEKRWNHYARPVGDSWRVDETYIKVKGQWVYLYRAVDKQDADDLGDHFDLFDRGSHGGGHRAGLVEEKPVSLFALSPKLEKAIALILDPWQPSTEPELIIWRRARLSGSCHRI